MQIHYLTPSIDKTHSPASSAGQLRGQFTYPGELRGQVHLSGGDSVPPRLFLNTVLPVTRPAPLISAGNDQNAVLFDSVDYSIREAMEKNLTIGDLGGQLGHLTGEGIIQKQLNDPFQINSQLYS